MDTKGNANFNQRKRVLEMKTLPAILISLVASLAIGVSTTRAQVMYSLEDLGVVKGMDSSEAAAINAQGFVTGTAYKGQDTCAFHYDVFKKFMEDAGGLNSRGFGINSLNVVVGDFFPVSPMEPRSHAAVFKGGVPMDIGVLKGQLYSRANGVNAIGQVVGYSGQKRDGSESRAFLWSNQTGMLDIGTLGGAYAQASAINDAGFITGASQTQGMGAMLTTHAFLYQFPSGPYPRQARMADLGVLGGGTSYGMAINNNNHVVGYSTLKFSDERVHAFLHNGKGMIDLGSLGGPSNRWGSDVSVALGINNYDQVVGYTFLPVAGQMPIQQVAFLWRPGWNGTGQMINLNSLLFGEGKNYLVFSATGINDNGKIAASAYYMPTGAVHAVILTPNGPVTN
jgi:probable HAF family extracellular repeat protein